MYSKIVLALSTAKLPVIRSLRDDLNLRNCFYLMFIFLRNEVVAVPSDKSAQASKVLGNFSWN